MARCTNCGTENKSDARFCRQCGKTLEAETQPPAADDPVTVVPEPEAPLEFGTAKRGGLVIGLVLAGFAAATGVGYYIGTRSSGSPKVEPAAIPELPGASNAQPGAPEAPAAIEQALTKPTASPEKAKRAQAASAKLAVQPSPPAAVAPSASPEIDSPSENLAKLRQELAACGKYNVFCQEKARWRRCKDIWGTVPECPQAKPNIPTN